MWTDTGVANDLLFIILVMPLDPFINLISPSLLKKAYELIKTKAALSTQKTQSDLNQIYEGLPFCPGTTASKYCRCFFITMFIVPLHPICSVLGAFLFVLFFWVDRLVLLRISNYPQFTAVDLILSYLRYAEVGIIFHWASYCTFEGLAIGRVRPTLIVLLAASILLYILNLQFYLKKWMRNQAKKAITQEYQPANRPQKLKPKPTNRGRKQTARMKLEERKMEAGFNIIEPQSPSQPPNPAQPSEVVDSIPSPGLQDNISPENFFQSLKFEQTPIVKLEALLDELRAEECFGTDTYWTSDPVEVLWQSIQAIKRFFTEIDTDGPRDTKNPEHVISQAVESQRYIEPKIPILEEPPRFGTKPRQPQPELVPIPEPVLQLPIVPQEPELVNKVEQMFLKPNADLIDTEPTDFLVSRKVPLPGAWFANDGQPQRIRDPTLDYANSPGSFQKHEEYLPRPYLYQEDFTNGREPGVCTLGPNKRHK